MELLGRDIKCNQYIYSYKKLGQFRGISVAHSKCPTSAQVMTSWFVSSSPTLGSLLAAQSLEPASDSVSPSLSKRKKERKREREKEREREYEWGKDRQRGRHRI